MPSLQLLLSCKAVLQAFMANHRQENRLDVQLTGDYDFQTGYVHLSAVLPTKLVTSLAELWWDVIMQNVRIIEDCFTKSALCRKVNFLWMGLKYREWSKIYRTPPPIAALWTPQNSDSEVMNSMGVMKGSQNGRGNQSKSSCSFATSIIMITLLCS